jgi:glycosyltransferase involved in cell wall biosynthesis
MRISIIIPAFNEERLLAASPVEIHAASRVFAERGWVHEVIVCDNNSSDRTAEVAREAGAQVVFEPVNQIARARNTGAASASGDWLLFIDADSHPAPELFADVAEQIESGRVLGGGVTIRMDNDRWLVRCLTGVWNLVSRVRKLVAGSFIFVEAAACRRLSCERIAGRDKPCARARPAASLSTGAICRLFAPSATRIWSAPRPVSRWWWISVDLWIMLT